MISKPTDVQVYEDTLASFWINNEGILNIVTKPVLRTKENTQVFVSNLKKLLGGKKVFVISDLTRVGEISEEARDYYKKELPGMFNAIAMVAGTEMGRMVGAVVNFAFNPTIPTRIFRDEKEARAWLKDLKENGELIVPSILPEKKVKGNLVLVDDDVAEEMLMKFALEQGKWKINVKFFSQPEKALQFMRETNEEIFLIISDINMPGMDGFEFKQQIDKDSLLSKKSIPFIYASNSVMMEDIAKAYDNGVQGYFKKPADTEEAVLMMDKIFNYWLVSRHPHKLYF
jgi:CheY-like chemotaxis protein